MADLYFTDVAQNAQKTRDSSHFGTRKLAFYTVVIDQDAELAYALDGGGDPIFSQPVWQESNSLYYKMVQALQEANVELYYVGLPRNTNESNYHNWSGLKPTNSDCFMIGIADNADSPIAWEGTNTYDAVEIYSVNGDEGWVAIDDNITLYLGQKVYFTGTAFGGLVVRKPYYVLQHEWDGTYTRVQISDTVDPTNGDGTPDYPATLTGNPGSPVMTLIDGATGLMAIHLTYFDCEWQGTAGDSQYTCNYDPIIYKDIYAQKLGTHIFNATGQGVDVWRCQNTFGVFPASWAQ
jgi:hypothetical protein